jgi:uncharacterized protein YbgA (DUF1722 family)
MKMLETKLYKILEDRKAGIKVSKPEEESDLHQRLCEIFNEGSKLLMNFASLKNFLESAKKKPNIEKWNKLLIVAQKVLVICETKDFKATDEIIEEMFEHKFYGTSFFSFLEEMMKMVEKIKRDMQVITGFCSKVTRIGDKTKGLPLLKVMREEQKVDISRVLEIINSINSLPVSIRESYTEDLKTLKAKADASEKYRGKLKEFMSKYERAKGVVPKVDLLIAEFEKLVKDYNSLEFGSIEFKKDLETLCWFVKANCSFEGASYDGSVCSIEGWKKIKENLKDFNCQLIPLLDLKIESSKNIAKEVERIKTVVKTPNVDKSKMPTLAEVEKIRFELQQDFKEMDFITEKFMIENLVQGIQSKLKILQGPTIVNLSEYKSAVDFLKKSPMNLTEELEPFLVKEKEGLDFLNTVNNLTGVTFKERQEELETVYRDLKIRIPVWEDLVISMKSEEKILERIDNYIKGGVIEVHSIQELREHFKSIKFMKDFRVEIKLMILYVKSLRNEYTMRHSKDFLEESPKPAVDFMALGSLVTELDELITRARSVHQPQQAEISLMQDYLKFIHDLYTEAKKYIETNIYGLKLKELLSMNIATSFKKLVDLTGPILDYKCTLEMHGQRKDDYNRSMFLNKENQKKRAAMLEAQPVVDPEGIEPRSGTFAQPTEMDSAKKGDQERTRREGAGDAKGANHHPFRDEEEAAPVKPMVSPTGIGQDLRNYYLKMWKRFIENNPYLDTSGLDALMTSKSLEKGIFLKFKKSPLQYDQVCNRITLLLKNVTTYLHRLSS